MDEDSAAPVTNSSALVGAVACVLAVISEAIALSLSGDGRQLFELFAILLAAAAIGLGFSGFTVGRLGAPRMMLALIVMVAGAVVLVAVLVLAVV